MTRISKNSRLQPRRELTLLASSTKYKFKEERKRVLKLSVKKLRSIEDPEAYLSRSVLINNTLKRLQSEVREEKMAQKMVYSSPYNFYSIEKYREEKQDNNGNTPTSVSEFVTNQNQGFEADDEESSTSSEESDSSSNPDPQNSLEDELLTEIPKLISNDLEESEIGKRPATPVPWDSNPSAEAVIKSSENCDNDLLEAVRTECWTKNLNWPQYSPSQDSNQGPSQLDFSPNISAPAQSSNEQKCYSCGQSSLFQSELQSVVFNSLIASLET